MKKKHFLIFALFCLRIMGSNAQIINATAGNGVQGHSTDIGHADIDTANNCNTWVQQANFAGAARYYDAGFSIGNYGFIGCGSDVSAHNYNDFYKWNQLTNTWSAIASYPGGGYQYTPVSFAIEGKGYVGLGWTGSAGDTDLWRYDTASNTWTQMASLPGAGRYDEAVFVIGHKAYIIGGSTGGPPYLEDVWMYDAHANTWKQMNNSPAGKTDDGPAFAIGNHGYYGGGKDGISSSFNTFWEYDTASDTWTSIAPFPTASTPSGVSRAFVIGSKGYVCTGTKSNSLTNDMSDGYAYDTNTRAWVYFTNTGTKGLERGYAVAFTINNCGYIGTGGDSIGLMLKDLWGFCPCMNQEGVPSISKSSAIFNLYPNPNNGVFNLSIRNEELGIKSHVEVYNMLGQIIYSTSLSINNSTFNINLGSQPNGVYLYRVLTETGSLVSDGKFVIQK